MAWHGLDDRDRRSDLVRVLLHVLVAAGVIVLLLLLWWIREALLLTFASIILAVLLFAATDRVRRWTGLSQSWSLTVVAMVLVVAIGLLAWLVGAQVQSQVSELFNRLPQAVQSFEQRFGISLFGSGDRQGGSLSSNSGMQWLVGRLASVGQTAAVALSSLVLVIVGAFFFAADPKVYRSGLVKLFPVSQHARVEDTLGSCGHALRLWLKAELIAMAIVGTLVGLGTWLIGLPAPIGLGLFAAITEFVPVIGPIIGAVPALLFALGQGGNTLLWTLLLFVAIQQLESNVIAPLVERRMVEIPPALLLFAVVAVGLLFGILGVIIAAPLAVVMFVAVKKLYVREMLGEETSVPGED